MAEDKKNIQGLNEYIRQGEPQEQERGLSRSLDNDMERFFRNMLLGETTTLRNREMHLDWKPEADSQRAKSGFQSANKSVQSANPALPLPPKCKNCTLEEIAVLRVIRQEPAATQKHIATEIGKSERTVKSITVRLTEQGILVRKNGKRNGYWEIVE